MCDACDDESVVNDGQECPMCGGSGKKIYSYKVVDPQGVYEDQVVEVPFSIDSTQSPHVVIANYAAVKAIAIEGMHGAPISKVDAQHIRDMFESLQIEVN